MKNSFKKRKKKIYLVKPKSRLAERVVQCGEWQEKKKERKRKKEKKQEKQERKKEKKKDANRLRYILRGFTTMYVKAAAGRDETDATWKVTRSGARTHARSSAAHAQTQK